MRCNSSLTIYHKGFDKTTKLETWIRYNYDKVWFFGGKGAGIRKGYENANDVEIRLPYNQNENLEVTNFDIGDIIVKGTLTTNIQTQQDLIGYETYNITSINDNNFGINQHIHIGGK